MASISGVPKTGMVMNFITTKDCNVWVNRGVKRGVIVVKAKQNEICIEIASRYRSDVFISEPLSLNLSKLDFEN